MTIKVRKRHRCEWCHEPIEVGQEAETDGHGIYSHPECSAACGRCPSYRDCESNGHFICWGFGANTRGKNPEEERDEEAEP